MSRSGPLSHSVTSSDTSMFRTPRTNDRTIFNGCRFRNSARSRVHVRLSQARRRLSKSRSSRSTSPLWVDGLAVRLLVGRRREEGETPVASGRGAAATRSARSRSPPPSSRPRQGSTSNCRWISGAFKLAFARRRSNRRPPRGVGSCRLSAPIHQNLYWISTP